MAAILLLSRLPFSKVGLSIKRLGFDCLAGTLMGIAIFGFHEMTAIAMGQKSMLNIDLGLQRDNMIALGWESVCFLVAALLANSFAEEIVMRGYLIDRFERLFSKTWLAVGLAAMLFGSYHIYQGWLGAIEGVVIGIVFGIWFARTRRLAAPIIAHTISNLLLVIFYTEVL
jgi:membrane protease YdiL (CAAX protease family)